MLRAPEGSSPEGARVIDGRCEVGVACLDGMELSRKLESVAGSFRRMTAV